jgi:hypothetical protein
MGDPARNVGQRRPAAQGRVIAHAAALRLWSATMAPAAARLVALVRSEPPDPAAIRAHLDGLALADRIEAIAALAGPGLQRRLWEAVAGAPVVTLGDLVPPDAPPLREVVFHGKNSLPAFTRFQKRFCRAPAGEELWGYNHQSLAWLTGPGYFVVHEEPARGAAIDYRRVPPRGAEGWPPVAPNDAGLSRFVYKDMVDYLRRVSRDVFVGSAHRDGRELGNYFVLCREP